MTAYRRDIDGLRGIAILAVLLFHAFTNLIPGGYVGVDIFFVISGYLITGILLHGLNEGTFTFRQFYARRIRRIFPALAIVLLSTWIAGWFILFPEEYTELGKHMGASSLFISNIILWKEAGYFDRTAELKPLLHLWSLGVEEQFYIFWPALLLVFHRKRHGWAGLVALTAISFVANLAFLHNAPTGTFFLLPTRFWQLGLGGMLAYAELKPLPRRVQSPILCMLGLALILIACFTFTDASPYPGWRALLPTIGAALIILSASGGKLIGNKPLLWLGLISYPLYLWHWPLLAYARILHAGEPSVTARIIAVALA
ncbi:MAG: acyltransferase family protein, partial [Rickettsiales bacterium]